MKIITFDGRLGRDATVHTAKNGRQFISFTVANNSYSGGQQRVDWFDVVCYDPYVIENSTKYLTKGTFVIITGTINSTINVRGNDMFINHNVNAINIDRPRFGRPQGEEQAKEAEPQVSVYTASTSTYKAEAPSAPVSVPTPAPAYVNYSNDSSDDLPF